MVHLMKRKESLEFQQVSSRTEYFLTKTGKEIYNQVEFMNLMLLFLVGEKKR